MTELWQAKMALVSASVRHRRKLADLIADPRNPEGKTIFRLADDEPVRLAVNVGKGGLPEVHMKESDVWYALEGDTTATVGGVLLGSRQRPVNGILSPDELVGDSILGGTQRLLSPDPIERRTLYIAKTLPHALAPSREGENSALLVIKLPLKRVSIRP